MVGVITLSCFANIVFGLPSQKAIWDHHRDIFIAEKGISLGLQGHVVWEGTVAEFDSTEEPIVRQFASGSLDGPIKYE